MSIRNIVFSTLVVATLFVAGCKTDYFNQTEGNMPPQKDIDSINKGMTKDQVRKIMGSPSVISSVDHKSWIYMSSTMKRLAFFKPEELERKVVAIEFNTADKVEKVVQLTKENGKDVKISSDSTPVMGSEEGFMRKYFGGVGQYLPMEPTKANDGL